MAKFKPVIKPKEMLCWHCKKKSQYKCPKTQLRYCSLDCYQKLKQNKKSGVSKPFQQLPKGSHAISPVKRKPMEEKGTSIHTSALTNTWQKYDDEDDRLREGRLDLLAKSSEIKSLLTNQHLRQMLTFIDSSRDKDTSMEDAMKEPIFMEFADACLALVESDSDGDKSPEPKDSFVEVKEFELLQF